MRQLSGYDLVLKAREIGDRNYRPNGRGVNLFINDDFTSRLWEWFRDNRIERKGFWMFMYEHPNTEIKLSSEKGAFFLDLLAEFHREGWVGKIYD